MKRFCLGLLFMLFTLQSAPILAGEEIVSFVNNKDRNRVVVIPKANLRALIAEFLDPAQSGIGQSLSYLLWKETLTAISDQADAGVIIARAPEGENLTKLIGDRYHLAAKEIAEFQKAAMMLWGAVIENPDGDLTINTHLTLLPTSFKTGQLTLRLASRSGRGEGLKAQITRNKFNFSAVNRTRDELFDRPIITRRKTNLRLEPDQRSGIRRVVPAQTLLHAVDMTGPWFKVKIKVGEFGYIRSSQVAVPPKKIEIDRRDINVRSGPGTNHRIVINTSLKGSYPVLDMRYNQGQGLWYAFSLDDKKVWIYATLVKPRYSLPAVHFLAGLYRYYVGRFDAAAVEFEQFVSVRDDTVNTNLATGYQLLGASRVMGKSPRHLRGKALSAFDRSVALTPYDPTAYNLRALANIAVKRNVAQAMQDLEKSASLDRTNEVGATLAKDLKILVNNPTPADRTLLRQLGPLKNQVSQINRIKDSFVYQPSGAGKIKTLPKSLRIPNRSLERLNVTK